MLDEVLELFPSPYIHIGGDEAPKKRWEKCPDCQQRIRTEGLKDEQGLIDNAIVQFWARGRQRLLAAIRTGKQATVMSTYLDTYLDHSYSLMPLSRAYRYEPIPTELDEKVAASILGLEFPLWTEWVPNRSRLDYQAYPRLTALAETGWTAKDRKSLPDFRRRLEDFLERLTRLGVRYAPLQEAEPSKFKQWFGIFTIVRPQTKISD